MRLVTIHASHVARVMRAALPEELVAASMALHAGGIFLRHGVLGITGEADGNGVFAAPGFHVRFARTVTGLAAASFIRGMRMGHYLPHDRVLEAVVLIFVTGDTGIAAHVIAVRLGGCFCLLRWGSRFIQVLVDGIGPQ